MLINIVDIVKIESSTLRWSYKWFYKVSTTGFVESLKGGVQMLREVLMVFVLFVYIVFFLFSSVKPQT